MEKSRYRIRCPECGEWATFVRHESGWHYCMECAAKFSGLDVMAMVVIS